MPQEQAYTSEMCEPCNGTGTYVSPYDRYSESPMPCVNCAGSGRLLVALPPARPDDEILREIVMYASRAGHVGYAPLGTPMEALHHIERLARVLLLRLPEPPARPPHPPPDVRQAGTARGDGPVTATYIKALDGFTGDARLYALNPPIKYSRWDSEANADVESETEHVVVSATVVYLSGPETYIFPADEEGHITSWLEVEGSYRGGLDHERALRGAGYEVPA